MASLGWTVGTFQGYISVSHQPATQMKAPNWFRTRGEAIKEAKSRHLRTFPVWKGVVVENIRTGKMEAL
jgi:hypothetical protein